MVIIAAFLSSVAVAQDTGEGEGLFRLRCGSCHTVQAGQDRNGPNLAGVIGRRPGTVSGARYSAAMKSVDINWDGQSLDRFLSDPR
jgi:cytochrome c